IIINGPFERAVEAVKVIGPPMTVANAVGVGLFIAFLEDVYAEQKKIQASATQLAFEIATKILPFMRRGLNKLSAGNASLVIGRMVESVDAVAFASKERLLALARREGTSYVLEENQAAFGPATTERLAAGKVIVLNVKAEVQEMFAGFPFGSAVITPLQESEVVVGALILFKTKDYGISAFEVELANGLHHLISTQIEISRADAQTELVAQAEINALQAQINPHFLFNALNTIVYYCIKQPETANELIVHLANFYRRNLANPRRMVSLHAEIAHVQSYVEIEAARFKGKLKVIYDIDEASRCLVPPLILQPLVENAIKHGILPKGEGGTVTIASADADGITYVTVADDGVGMSRDTLVKALEHDPDRKRIGLYNVNSRLKNIYGNDYGLIIESAPGTGTRVTLPIGVPRKGAEEAGHDKGAGG
ncbi:MAG TPA: histidine kinase, partial [Negativicutes bacterium]|nr:histidine kinase [Negativicutes bacterium]